MRSKIADINDTLREREITDLFFDEPFPKDYDWENRTFVLQMRLINLNQALRMKAISDQYRASKMRDWLVDEVYLTNLIEYDQQLKEEWELIFEQKTGEYDLDSLPEELAQKIGKEIYFDVQKLNIPIHKHRALQKAYVTRGSFHFLADKKSDMVVGWHPHFKEIFTSGKE